MWGYGWTPLHVVYVCLIAHYIAETLVWNFMPPVCLLFSVPQLMCHESAIIPLALLLHHLWGNQSHSGPSDTLFNTLCPVRFRCPLIRFDSANWISRWNKHPFMHMSVHTDTHELDIQTLLSWLFTRCLLFSVKAANKSKLLPTTWKYQVPDCSAVMELTADQSNYGPTRGSTEAGEGPTGAKGGCRPQGTGEWKVPGSWAANCHCSAVTAFGVDQGVGLPLPSRLKPEKWSDQYLSANIKQLLSSGHLLFYVRLSLLSLLHCYTIILPITLPEQHCMKDWHIFI